MMFCSLKCRSLLTNTTRFFSTVSSIDSSLKVLSGGVTKLKGRVYSPSEDRGCIIRHGNQLPLAVLVGWAASNHKALGKYAAVYDELGVPALCVTPSIFHVWSLSHSEKYTKNILKTIDSSFQWLLILHLFSGAANVILPTLTRRVHEYKNLSLKSVVFDCGPSLFSYESGMAAAKQVLDQGGFNKLTYNIARYTGQMVDIANGKRHREELDKAIRRPVLSIPQLYLHSDEDTVCPVSRVEQVMEEQIKMGRNVVSKRFSKAPHVRLLPTYPEEYRRHVTSFLQNVEIIKSKKTVK